MSDRMTVAAKGCMKELQQAEKMVDLLDSLLAVMQASYLAVELADDLVAEMAEKLVLRHKPVDENYFDKEK